MSAVVPSASMSPPEPTVRDNYLTHSRGVRSWIFTLDHKRIGVLYLVAILSFLLLGAVFAILLRGQLLLPGPALLIFIVIIPAIPAVLGNFVLPMMLGAKSVAFPRINRLAFHIYCAGALFLLYGIAGGVLHTAFGKTLPGGFSLDAGWDVSVPYGTGKAAGSMTAAGFGLLSLGISAMLTGVNFIVSIHMLRPRGMTWFRMPLFLWALYGTAIVQIVANSILAITLFIVATEHFLHLGLFDPGFAGDPILFQHFFWFYAHPAVYVMILPAMGIISELISTFSRKHIFGYKFIAYSSISMVLLGFLAWGQHMFVSGQSGLVNAIFSLLTFGVAVPSAIQVCNWLHTLYRGSIRLQTPMLYALGFIVIFTIGILSGLFLGAIATSIHLSATSFEMAHFDYVLVGSTLFAFLGGMYYWWPKITGRMYCEKAAAVGAFVVFVGFNTVFFPLFVAGSRGVPGRYATYAAPYPALWLTSSVGAYILIVGLVIALLTWIHSLLRGRNAPANPWGANSLEWQTTSPPPAENGQVALPVGDPYDLTPWRFISLEAGWVRQGKAADKLLAASHVEFIQSRVSDPSAASIEPLPGRAPQSANLKVTAAAQEDSGKLGVWLFLGTILLVFGGLFCAYAAYRYNYPRAFAYAHQFVNRKPGVILTFILIASSFFMAWGVRCAQLGRRYPLILCLLVTLLGGVSAVWVRATEYRGQYQHHLWIGAANRYHKDYNGDPAADEPREPAEAPVAGDDAEVRRQGPADLDPLAGTLDEPKIKPSFNSAVGLMPAGAALEPVRRHLGYKDLDKAERAHISTFFSLYFLMNGLHTLFWLAGMGLITWILLRSIRRKFRADCFAPVDLVGLYWHLLTPIWFFVFPLLYLIH